MDIIRPEANSRERLRRLLRSDAILYGGNGQAIVDHVGQPMSWIFYSWGITLSHEGASLAADCLIDALSRFDSVQVAGVGMTGLPLVSSIVSRGLGRYTGLYVRDEREKWGTRRQVEGVGDKNRPVVVVDDCVCSGGSLRRAFAALEKDGYRVEGALCLVNFPWKGGTEWVAASGYRIETLFDVWTDLEMFENLEVPSYRSVRATVDSGKKVPEGLTPADAARWAAVHFLNSGLIPTPPETFDRSYDASGGVMVSFRDRVSDHRIARDGFYHLKPTEACLGRDIVLATAKTLLSSKGAVAQYGLDRLKLGVTLFGEQVPAVPRELDFQRFGVLIRSSVQPWKLAGALPNTQFFVSEIEQFRHARFTNARLFVHEPFAMFRHTVSKSIESGCSWPFFGVSANTDDDVSDNIGEVLIARTREALLAAYEGHELRGDKLPADLFPEQIKGLAVTLYHRGMIGCWTSFRPGPDDMIREATIGAWNDKRWKRRSDLSLADIDIVVSVFRLAEILGSVSIEHAAFKVRLGKDSLAVAKDKKSSILLSYIPCHNSWSKKEMAEHLLRKAGISEPPFYWTTYATRSWLGRSGQVSVLDSGYPRRRNSDEAFPYRATVRLLANYIVDKIGPYGLPDYCYYPVFNRTVPADSAARVILALEALMHAGDFLEDPALRKTALSGLRHCCEHITNQQRVPRLELAETICGAAAEVFLINAVYQSGERNLREMPAVKSLVSKLRGFFHSDGAITWQREGRRLESDLDLFPGSALRMAASVAEVEGPGALPPSLDEHLSWNRRRFGLRHSWGMVFWQTQGWAALNGLTGAEPMATFVYELADWAIRYQLDKSGAFLVDYAPEGPGFHTACVLEALADAWSVARRAGETERERNYRQAWVRGMRFMERLIIRDDDRFAMPEPAKSLGGVRQSLTSSAVRIDYVAHTLLALVKGLSGTMVS
jgi:orotate phosphoribosyltransferase/AMMECR1 domain-containing protein